MEIFMKNPTFFEFLSSSKTAYHAVDCIAETLLANGYTRLYENDEWSLEKGGRYFVIRDGSSIIAFRNNGGSFQIAASHSASPAFRVKGVKGSGGYARFDVEKYGGGILYSWLDRPLAVAGRAVVREGGTLTSKTLELPFRVSIPSVAIHFNRTVNDGIKLNPAVDMLPLAAIGNADLTALVAATLGKNAEDIVSHELMLVCAEEPTLTGINGELVLSPRLDDLAAAYTSLAAFIESGDGDFTPVLAVFDNEEVGSDTKQGAASTFLHTTLKRISCTEDEYLCRLATSYMVSSDNAHARHPNHPELSDAENAPVLAGGVVIKCNANPRYTTAAVSEAIFTELCGKAGVATMKYFNRADMPGGSTLGSIADTKVSVHTVDIGLPQLAMHSAVETCAMADVEAMTKAILSLYTHKISIRGENITVG